MPPARMILMCGLPGSGTTTVAKEIARREPVVRLCTDDWQAALGVDHADGAFHDRLEAQLWTHAVVLLRLGVSVVFEKGLWLRSERDEKRREADELGVDVELHWFDVPSAVLADRLERRSAEARKEAYPVTGELLEAYRRVFEPPSGDELRRFATVVVHRPDPGVPTPLPRTPEG